jgi:hypothetical protein
VQKHESAVDAAVRAGIERIVYLSFLQAAPDGTPSGEPGRVPGSPSRNLGSRRDRAPARTDGAATPE